MVWYILMIVPRASEVFAQTVESREFQERIVQLSAFTVRSRTEGGMALYRGADAFVSSDLLYGEQGADDGTLSLRRLAVDEDGRQRPDLFGLIHSHFVNAPAHPEHDAMPSGLDIFTFMRLCEQSLDHVDGVLTTHSKLGGALLHLMRPHSTNYAQDVRWYQEAMLLGWGNPRRKNWVLDLSLIHI